DQTLGATLTNTVTREFTMPTAMTFGRGAPTTRMAAKAKEQISGTGSSCERTKPIGTLMHIPKPEIQDGRLRDGASAMAPVRFSNFGIRASFGLRPSVFGFRRVPRTVRTYAFTLVEMMVVVVLIAILTAMIIPEMKGTYEDAFLRSTSRE